MECAGGLDDGIGIPARIRSTDSGRAARPFGEVFDAIARDHDRPIDQGLNGGRRSGPGGARIQGVPQAGHDKTPEQRGLFPDQRGTAADLCGWNGSVDGLQNAVKSQLRDRGELVERAIW